MHNSAVNPISLGRWAAITAGTAVKCPAFWAAVGASAFSANPILGSLQLYAGIHGASSKAETWCSEQGIKGYKSIKTILSEWSSNQNYTKKAVFNFNKFPLVQKAGVTISDSFKSPAFSEEFGAVVYGVNALVELSHGNVARAVSSLFFLFGKLKVANYLETNQKTVSNLNPNGFFQDVGVRSLYSQKVPKKIKDVFNNAGFWFYTGSFVRMAEKGAHVFESPLSVAASVVTLAASVVSIKPLFSKENHSTGTTSAVRNPAENLCLRVFGEEAGRSQKIGAIGLAIGAIHSLTRCAHSVVTGNPVDTDDLLIAVAFGTWFRSNWQYSDISNKNAAVQREREAAAQAYQPAR
jgi:hypothetical protein